MRANAAARKAAAVKEINRSRLAAPGLFPAARETSGNARNAARAANATQTSRPWLWSQTSRAELSLKTKPVIFALQLRNSAVSRTIGITVRAMPRSSSVATRACLAAVTPPSRVDPLHEPLQYSAPYLVLADLILDAVLEVRIVVDLDHHDRFAGLLQIHAVEPAADRARGAQRAFD